MTAPKDTTSPAPDFASSHAPSVKIQTEFSLGRKQRGVQQRGVQKIALKTLVLRMLCFSGCFPGVFRVFSGCFPGVFRVFSWALKCV
eukprot:1673103-Amphidinium_carterae.1